MATKKSFPFGPEDMASGAVPLSDAVKESAQQIWLAGLGAFSKAQAEGGKVFEALVKEGVNMQRKTQTVAEEKITEAAQRMTSAATEMGSRAAGQWDKLETIFEDRVAKALGRLGIPTARDLQALNERPRQRGPPRQQVKPQASRRPPRPPKRLHPAPASLQPSRRPPQPCAKPSAQGPHAAKPTLAGKPPSIAAMNAASQQIGLR